MEPELSSVSFPPSDNPPEPELSPAQTIQHNTMQYFNDLHANTTHYTQWLIGQKKKAQQTPPTPPPLPGPEDVHG